MTCHITFEPVGKRVPCQKEAVIFEVARDAGISLDSFCDGKGTCGKCKIRILSGKVSSLTEKEKEVLSPEDIARGYRLACLTKAHQSIRIEVPLEGLLVSQRLQLAGGTSEVGADPVIQAFSINLSPPSLLDVRSDQTRIIDYLTENFGCGEIEFDLPVQWQLPDLLRANTWQAKIGIRGREVIWIGEDRDELLGVAVDLGTTRIAAYLVELKTGKTLASVNALNPQAPYGADVINRINYTITNGGERLTQVVIENINRLIQQLCTGSGLSHDNIVEAVIAGNTAMHHFFLGLPVDQLGVTPYIPAVTAPVDIKARELGLQIAPAGCVHLLPNIAGFLGADHVAMLLATELYNTGKTVLAIDIGTSTELSLAVGGNITSCSCASGSTLDGANIKDGMRATGGAIEKVRITDSSVEIRTIDNEPPLGLCGSGILDAVAQLLESNILNELGKLKDHPRVRTAQSGKEFLLVPGEESGSGRDITITPKDINAVQLVKGAVTSGTNVLLENANIGWEEIDEIIVTGAFGSYIDVVSAVAIGLLPPLPGERFTQVGNAAGAGARLALLSGEQRKLAVEIARKVNYIELATHSGYFKMFTKAIKLAPWQTGNTA